MSTQQSAALPQTKLLPAPGSGGRLTLVGIADGHLWYTEPASATAWQTFADLESSAGEIGSLVDTDVNLGQLLTVFAVNGSGNMYFTYLTGGGWVGFTDVKAAAGKYPGCFIRVAVTTSDHLDVCGVTNDGRIWHAIRQPTGSWVSFSDVKSQAGEIGNVVQISCAGFDGDLWLCAITDDGHLWLAIRRVTGAWVPFFDVEKFAGERGFFVDVDCVNLYGNLHIFGATSDGRLWQAISSASWSAFVDVKASTGDPGPVIRVAAGGGVHKSATLQLAVITGDKRLWHSDRGLSGAWSSFVDVEATAGDRGDFVEVGLDGAFIDP